MRGIFNAKIFKRERYFCTDHIIYEVLNPLKTELQFTLYNICVMLFFPFFHLSAERFIFDEKKNDKL